VNKFFIKLLKRKESGVVIPALMLFIVFTFTSESFLTSYNMFNVSRTLALYLFVALSQAVVLLVGGMNLSVGAIGGLSTITIGYLMSTHGLSGWIAVPSALIVGIAAGAFNGIIITKLKINSFIVTLSTSFLFTGIVYGISKGYPYIKIAKSFTYVGRKAILGFPVVFILAMFTLYFIHLFYQHTVLGRRLLSTGGNINAARLSGINTDRMILNANIISGFFAALAGVLWVSRMGSAQPATGQNWLIISFAVAIIGGTSLDGGVISSISLFAGAVILVLIKNGLIMLEANVYFEQAFLGAIILLTVSLDSINTIFNNLRESKNHKRNQSIRMDAMKK
jgi:ribose transport system permease protein